jgi:hypothetical protein
MPRRRSQARGGRPGAGGPGPRRRMPRRRSQARGGGPGADGPGPRRRADGPRLMPRTDGPRAEAADRAASSPARPRAGRRRPTPEATDSGVRARWRHPPGRGGLGQATGSGVPPSRAPKPSIRGQPGGLLAPGARQSVASVRSRPGSLDSLPRRQEPGADGHPNRATGPGSAVRTLGWAAWTRIGTLSSAGGKAGGCSCPSGKIGGVSCPSGKNRAPTARAGPGVTRRVRLRAGRRSDPPGRVARGGAGPADLPLDLVEAADRS